MTEKHTEKPDCYKCIHVGEVPGSVHKSCKHPKAGGGPAGMGALAILASVGRVAPVINLDSAEALNIRADAWGIKKGWFNWPYNFDPVWLQRCDGFEARPPKIKQKGKP